MTDIVLIAALSENRAIGKDNDLPWKLPSDLRHFKATTLGYPMIMGRKTWDSFGKRPLPKRDHIVISSSSAGLEDEYPNVFHAYDLREAIELARTMNDEKVFIIGGQMIFEQAIHLATHMILSHVQTEIEGDRFFPAFGDEWEPVNSTLCEDDDISFQIIDYVKKNTGPIFGKFEFDTTAFMSGQNFSKKWLCEELESIVASQYIKRPLDISILGGWYGMTNLMLQVRGNLHIAKVTSYDLDKEALQGARILNEPYIHQGVFETVEADVNKIVYDPRPDIVINTSVEHILEKDWFENIPSGTIVAIQATDMPNHDHKNKFYNIETFADAYPMKFLRKDQKKFDYGDWGFTRFMLIGIK